MPRRPARHGLPSDSGGFTGRGHVRHHQDVLTDAEELVERDVGMGLQEARRDFHPGDGKRSLVEPQRDDLADVGAAFGHDLATRQFVQ